MHRFVAMTLALMALTACHQPPPTTFYNLAQPQKAAAASIQPESEKGLADAIRHGFTTQFRQADFDKDGFLDTNEPHGLIATAFAQADRNKDYRLSLAEWLRMQKRRHPQIVEMLRNTAIQAFRRADRDYDHAVTMQEFIAAEQPAPVPPGTVPYAAPVPSAVPGGGYGSPGYGQPGPGVDLRSLRALYVLSDVNRDHRLTLDEFEDLIAWRLVANMPSYVPPSYSVPIVMPPLPARP